MNSAKSLHLHSAQDYKKDLHFFSFTYGPCFRVFLGAIFFVLGNLMVMNFIVLSITCYKNGNLVYCTSNLLTIAVVAILLYRLSRMPRLLRRSAKGYLKSLENKTNTST